VLSVIERVQQCYKEQRQKQMEGNPCTNERCNGCKYEIIDPNVFRAYVQGREDVMNEYNHYN
jgi:hypothetical protein